MNSELDHRKSLIHEDSTGKEKILNKQGTTKHEVSLNLASAGSLPKQYKNTHNSSVSGGQTNQLTHKKTKKTDNNTIFTSASK